MPFWSTQNRVDKIIKTVPVYKNFYVEELNLRQFKKWCKFLKTQNQLVGLNWSGKKATGYDLEPDDILDTIKSRQKTFLGRIFKR